MKLLWVSLLVLLSPLLGHAQMCSLPWLPSELSELEKILNLETTEVSKKLCEAISACEGSVGADCYRSSVYYQNALTALKSRNFGRCGLSADELATLYFYTGSGYKCLNRYLWAKEYESKLDFLRLTLKNALSKLPSYKGFVVRGTSLPAAVRKTHQIGNIVTYDGFTSTSTADGFNGEDKMVILSKTGKPIMGFSALNSEKEVLFAPGTKFKVMDAYEKNYTRFYILSEVTPNSSTETEETLNASTLKKMQQKRSSGYETWNCPPSGKKPKEIQQEAYPNLYSF